MRALRPLQIWWRHNGPKPWIISPGRGFSSEAWKSPGRPLSTVLAYVAVAGAGAVGSVLLLKERNIRGPPLSVLSQQRLPLVQYATLSDMEKERHGSPS